MQALRLFFNESTGSTREWRVALGISMTVLSLWVLSLMTFGFSLPVYVLAMFLIAGFIFVFPTIGLPIVILSTMWYERWFTLEPIVLGDVTIKLYPLDVVFLATIASILFHQAFGRRKWEFRLRRSEVLLLVFIFLCTVYFLFSFIAGTDDQALNVSAFKNYAFYALLYFLVVFTVKTLNDLKRILKVFLAGGFGIIVFVMIGILRGQGLWTEYTPLSTEGVRLLAFPHAFYLSIVLIITTVLFVYRLRPERVTILTMWMQLIGVLGSLMRHLWISLFATVGFLFIVLPQKARHLMVTFFAKNAAVITLFLATLAFVFTIFPLSGVSLRLQEFTDPLYRRAQSLTRSAVDSSARWRFFAWNAARESFIDSPVVGIGYGRELVIDFDTYRVIVPIRELHNSFLVLLVQMGLIGFFSFALFLLELMRLFIQAMRKKGMFWPYQLSFAAALFLFLGCAFWQPYFETNLTGIFFWILSGLLVVALRCPEGEPLHA